MCRMTERSFAGAALLLSSLSLGDCVTATAGSSLMDARAQARLRGALIATVLGP
jgi:hypothetical protein